MIEPNALDRFMGAIRALIRAELPRLKYLGTWAYSVTGVNGDGTVNASPSDLDAGLPALNNLSIVSGPEGGTAAPTPGNACYVRFINGDPTRPVVVGNQAVVRVATFDATEQVNVGPSAGTVVLAGGDAPVARDGDAVAVYFGTPGTGISIQGNFQIGTPTTAGAFTGTLTMLTPACGVITSGQPRVLA